MSKFDNIRKSIEDAKRKIEAIEANSNTLKIKKENIDKQLKALQEKRKKLEFFLERTTKTLESNNSSTVISISSGKSNDLLQTEIDSNWWSEYF